MSINFEFNRFIREYLALSQKDISTKVKSREWLINRVIQKIREKRIVHNYIRKMAKNI